MTDKTKDELDTAIRNWHVLNKTLRTFTEVDCKNALNRELAGNRREDIAIRLHTRYCTLRQARERDEIMVAVADIPSFLTGVPK